MDNFACTAMVTTPSPRNVIDACGTTVMDLDAASWMLVSKGVKVLVNVSSIVFVATTASGNDDWDILGPPTLLLAFWRSVLCYLA